MKNLKHVLVFVFSIASMGSVYAYPGAGYPDRVVLAQHRVFVTQPQPRPRRFVTQPNGMVYQRQYVGPPTSYPRATRMSADERRALRRQINEANQDMYNKNRSRVMPKR